MRRRLNYTGRKRILQKDVDFTILEEGDLQRFYVDLRLGEYELPATASVWIEAFDANAIMRFGYGTVGQLQQPQDNVLHEFQGVDSFYFRVKVTDSQDSAKLLAAAQRISPVRHEQEDDHRKALLRVTTSNTGHLPWQLEFPAGDYPILNINSEIDCGVALARSNQFFQAVVFPYVLETVLRRVLIEDEYTPGDDADPEDAWKEDWLAFAASLPGCVALDSSQSYTDEEHDGWIREASNAYAKYIRAIHKLRVELKEVE